MFHSIATLISFFLLGVISSLLIYLYLKKNLKMPPLLKEDDKIKKNKLFSAYIERIVSMVHSIFLLIYSTDKILFNDVIYDGELKKCDELVLMYSSGYLLFDTF